MAISTRMLNFSTFFSVANKFESPSTFSKDKFESWKVLIAIRAHYFFAICKRSADSLHMSPYGGLHNAHVYVTCSLPPRFHSDKQVSIKVQRNSGNRWNHRFLLFSFLNSDDSGSFSKFNYLGPSLIPKKKKKTFIFNFTHATKILKLPFKRIFPPQFSKPGKNSLIYFFFKG